MYEETFKKGQGAGPGKGPGPGNGQQPGGPGEVLPVV